MDSSIVQYTDYTELQILIAAGVDVEQSDWNGRTLLSYAIDRNDYTMIEYLIAAGADMHTHTPFDYHERIIELFIHEDIRRGGQTFSSDIYKRFFEIVCSTNDFDTAALILTNTTLSIGDLTDLIHKAQKTEIVKLLLNTCAERKFDVSKQIVQRAENLLMRAVVSRKVEHVKLLLTAELSFNEKCISFDFKCSYAETPFGEALNTNQLDVIKLFVELGADVNQKIKGKTPLMIAASSNYPNLVSFLVEHGAVVNMSTDLGLTALFYAVLEGSFECVEVLLKAGADPTIEVLDGQTALSIAKHKGFLRIANLM